MNITLDSNVLVYAFVPPLHKNLQKREDWGILHTKAKQLYESVVEGRIDLIVPFAVIVEVASVVASLTGKEEFGKDTALEIEDSATVVLFDSDLKERALDYSVKLKVGGFDSFIAITSIIYGSTLNTNDKPFFDKLTPFLEEYQFGALLFRDLDLRNLMQDLV